MNQQASVNLDCAAIEVGIVYDRYNTSPGGLTSKEASLRQNSYGANKLQEAPPTPAWKFLLLQFRNVMILILLVAAVIASLLGEWVDAIIIMTIVVLNAIIGFVQEYRADRAVASLKHLLVSHCKVLRDGSIIVLPSEQLVPGDVVYVAEGDAIPADIRLVAAHQLQVDEAALTGESMPVDKDSAGMREVPASPAEALNLLFCGTLVVHGRGTGVVVATGMSTAMGSIAGMLQDTVAPTPLQVRMKHFGRVLTYVIIIVCIVIFLAGWLRGEPIWSMALLAISLAVAAIPEALPALMTVALAKGARRMAHQQALIRRLPAVETLGSVTYICTDKTGTLTTSTMEVQEVLEVQPPRWPGTYSLPMVMALNHDVTGDKQNGFAGDPTEVALVRYATQILGEEEMQRCQHQWSRIQEIPFDSTRKCMATLHSGPSGQLLLVKGAPESIAQRLADMSQHQTLLEKAAAWSAQGLRLIAYAGTWFPDGMSTSLQEAEKDISWLGLAALADPHREEVPAAIKQCHEAGIQPIMITGDHVETAKAIAGQIGLDTAEGTVITGKELFEMDDTTLANRVESVRVYARVTPEQKLRIIHSLQQKGHFVAMTGDGVNDAPSLRAANIGIAMGIKGTEVSREAAHMILLDDNFATIVKAVGEGRRIYDNIRKFVRYIMTCNSAEVLTIFVAPLVGLPIPLLPVHILWINLITDGLPGLSLVNEQPEPNYMKRPPKPPEENLFARGLGVHIVWVGTLMAALVLGLQAYSIHWSGSHWQTMVFTTLAFAQLAHVLAIRSEGSFLFNIGLLSNPSLIGALLLTVVVQLAAIYLPFFNQLLRTEPLGWQELVICIGTAAIIFHAVEAEKWIRGRRLRKQSAVL